MRSAAAEGKYSDDRGDSENGDAAEDYDASPIGVSWRLAAVGSRRTRRGRVRGRRAVVDGDRLGIRRRIRPDAFRNSARLMVVRAHV
jgi:hypothetical protein